MLRRLSIAALAAACALPATAELSRDEKKAIEKKLEDVTLYMRMDAPCATGRHPYGVYKKPLVEVSPEGSNMDTSTTMNMGVFHADSTYWGIRINDPVELDEVDIDEDDYEVEIELEGVGPAEDVETVIKFVDIKTLEDFNKAFDQTFSEVPLQDLHEDWSDDMKKAVSERNLVDGMNKRQAFYIVGSPESFEKSEEDGKQIEIWRLRTDRGIKMGYFTAKAQKSDLPSSIRFEDGALVNVGSSGPGDGDGFSLDD
ncbi:MAG: hypothetical protein AAFY88_29295 [Acidobacteriota bacterium]